MYIMQLYNTIIEDVHNLITPNNTTIYKLTTPTITTTINETVYRTYLLPVYSPIL